MRFAVATAAVLTVALTAAVAFADSVGPISFEAPTYVVGDIDGQDGWKSTGPFDHAVAAQSLYSSFDSQSLRISNAVTSGSFGDQTFSKELVSEAGETDSTGRRRLRSSPETTSRRASRSPRRCRLLSSPACRFPSARTGATVPG